MLGIGNLYATDTILAPMTSEQITTVQNKILNIQKRISDMEDLSKEVEVPLTPEEHTLIMELQYDIDMLKLRLKLNRLKVNQ